MSRYDLKGRRVLVTGAARGMGLGMAVAFARKGANVVLWDLDADAVALARRTVMAQGVDVRADVVDLTDRDAIARTARSVLEETGPVDVLVNNAGVVSGKHLLDLTDGEIERTFDVNTLALFRTTRAFMPAMLEHGDGHIVTIASAGGFVGTARLVDYCSSKFAAIGFDDALRMEVKRLKLPIRTTVVCPFYVNTGMFDGVKTKFNGLLPILRPEDVVARTVRAVEKGTNRVIMPWFVYSNFLMRVLPIPVFDRIAAFFGMNRSMDEFRGRV